MQKFLGWLLVIGIIPFLGGCDSPQLTSIGMHMFKSMLFALPFVTLVIALIFLMNKYIVSSDGRTNERLCSIIGVLLFPALFVVAFGWEFGYNWIPMTAAVVLGVIIGWFSYVLDELMANFWEERYVTVPATLGLILGGWICVTMFTQVWLEGDMYVTNTACVKRVIIERYTYHYRDSDDGGSYYSWDYHNHAQRFALGDAYPELREGIDYQLGMGDSDTRDRIRKNEHYRFIGGHLFSEQRQQWRNFQWLLLSDPLIQFATGKVQRVQSDFYGHPMRNAGEVVVDAPLPIALSSLSLPTANDLPPAMLEFKVVMLGIDFMKMIFTEHEYRVLLYYMLALIAALGTLALFVEQMRQSVIIFTVCLLIVPLLVFLVVAARTGSLGSIGTRSRDNVRFGGGGFGGGGSSGRW